MRIAVRPADATGAEIRVLVAYDDDEVRQLLAILLRTTPGVSSVIEAKDGAEAVELGCGRQFDVAVLDLNMPRLDGVHAAIRLRAMQPSLKIALNSSSPELLRRRAEGLGLPLFDKIDFDRLREWVAQQSRRARAVGEVHPLLGSGSEDRKLDLCCSRCGYGVATYTPPARCPMCGCDATWAESPRRTSRRTIFDEQLAG